MTRPTGGVPTLNDLAPAPADALARLRRRRAGVLLLLACATLWSLNGILVKVTAADPIAFAALRSMVAAVAVLPFLWTFRGGRPPAGVMSASIVFHTLMVGFFIAAITWGTAAAGVILQYTGPAWVALIAWGVQRQRLGGATWAAVGLTCAGVLAMIAVPLWREPAFDPVGPACGLAAGLAFGALIVMLEKADRDAVDPATGARGANPIVVIGINNAGTAVLLLPVVFLLDRLHLSPTQWGLIVFCGVVQHALPYLLFQLGLQRVTAVEASLLVLLEPILSPTWVALFWGEMPTRWDVIGGAAILGALLLVATKRPPASAGPAVAD